MDAESFTVGLRIGGMVIFVWLLWRVVFDSWDVTDRPEPLRRRAWIHFRASIATLCFVMIFLASPENILRANNLIDDTVGFWMMSGVTVGAMIYATQTHHAFDIITVRRGSAAICAAISGLFLIYATVRASGCLK